MIEALEVFKGYASICVWYGFEHAPAQLHMALRCSVPVWLLQALDLIADTMAVNHHLTGALIATRA
jgi:hypothetical protein